MWWGRVEWFLERTKKLGTCQIVPNCGRTPISKYPLLKVPTFGAQGLKKCCLYPYCKISIKKNIFKGFTWSKICTLVCLKEKSEEKLKNDFCLTMGKTIFAHFGGLTKKLNQTEFQIFFLVRVLWSKMKVFANLKKSFIFKIFVIFENEISPTFWNWTYKNIPDRCPFSKIAKKCYFTPLFCEGASMVHYLKNGHKIPGKFMIWQWSNANVKWYLIIVILSHVAFKKNSFYIFLRFFLTLDIFLKATLTQIS